MADIDNGLGSDIGESKEGEFRANTATWKKALDPEAGAGIKEVNEEVSAPMSDEEETEEEEGVDAVDEEEEEEEEEGSEEEEEEEVEEKEA